MNYRETEDWYQRVLELLRQQRVLDALDKIASITSTAHEGHISRLDELRFTYASMLNYTIQGAPDPKRDLIYNRLLVSVYELADSLRMELNSKTSFSRLNALKHDLEREMRRDNEDMADSLQGLSFDHELDEMLRSTVLFDDETESETAIQHRKAMLRAFGLLWLTEKLSEDDAKTVSRIFQSSSLPWYEKSMMVSALTLGMIRCFDARKMELLNNLYLSSDPNISQRALVGILISISLYDHRILLYPVIMDQLNLLRDNPAFAAEYEAAIIQIIRAKDTEKITRKFRDEIVPDVIKLNEELSKKLNIDKLMTADEFEDKNPDWEKYFDNQPGLVRKLEELTNMQLEGADVFLSAFSMLKSFPFFQELPNWFMPFYKEHYSVVRALRNETESFRKTISEGIERSVYMCNSDKFSFILNLSHMPEPQKNLMVQMFGAEAEQLEELAGEEITDPRLRNKRIIIQYIQDLYRFFKLHPLKSEIGDIFSLSLDVHNTQIFELLFSDKNSLKNIASFYFDNNHYEEALIIYKALEDKGEAFAELFEKSGYCQQQKGNYHEAIENYRKADLFDTNRSWLLGKVAQCQLKMNDTRAALETYLELDLSEPDNLKTAAAIGTCYLNLNQPEKALDYFYRIEFADPGSARAMRPVAWCLLVLGKVTEAETYYNQLLSLEPNAYDYMNSGHVAFITGDKQLAAANYIRSIELRKGDIKSFLKGFISDRRLLLENGVDPRDLPLMTDFVRYRITGSI